jgi:hypothetical protein
MLSAFATVLLLAASPARTATTSAPKATNTVVERNEPNKKAAKADKPKDSAAVGKTIAYGKNDNEDNHKRDASQWTHSDVIQLFMAIFAAGYLIATYILVKHASEANEEASKANAASLKQTRTSNALTHKALTFNRESFKLTHRASLGIHKVISGEAPIDIVVVIRNVGATTAHYILPNGGFTQESIRGKPDIRAVKDPLLLLGFLSPGGGVSLGPGCDIAIKRSPHTDGLNVDESCDDLYYSASILYRDEWETWHRYRFIATYEPKLKDHWTAHSDQHRSEIEFMGFAKAFIDKLTAPD